MIYRLSFKQITQMSSSSLRVVLYLFAISSSSCVSHGELINFNEANFPLNQPEEILNAMNIQIQAEDLLRITVHSLNPNAVAPYNLEQPGQNNMLQNNQGTQTLELFTGYPVDQNGFIDFPVLGPLKVAGMTLEEAKLMIYDRIRPSVKDVVVNVRYLNFKITVIGEVNSPGTLRLTNKRVTLLEALGMAGDLTPYANRRSVLVIREEGGKRSYQRLNLQSAEIFSSPFFYLQQNDVISVDPIQAKVATVADPAQRIISYASAGLSIITLIIALSR